MDPAVKKAIATKVSWVGIIGNVILTLFKLFAGIVAHSGAMVSDSIHSASDVLSTFVVLISVKLAHRDADDKHPYGHERFECVAALLLAFFLCTIGIGIGYSGIKKIFADSSELAVPGALALVAAGVSIVTKEAMYWYTIIAARKIDSGVLKASAWDHRSDAFSSIGSFAGILGARIGFPKLDAVASVIICLFIIKVSYDIFMDAVNRMIDKSCSDEFVEEVKETIKKDPNIVSIDDIKTRMFGDRIYVDVEITVDGQKVLTDAHSVAENAHDMIEQHFPQVKHCMVHVNPTTEEDRINICK
ncbi:MAG: cation transporter [Clostridiales bacterium]|nr:cation transporter [Clostridiales bacterium]